MEILRLHQFHGLRRQQLRQTEARLRPGRGDGFFGVAGNLFGHGQQRKKGLQGLRVSPILFQGHGMEIVEFVVRRVLIQDAFQETDHHGPVLAGRHGIGYRRGVTGRHGRAPGQVEEQAVARFFVAILNVDFGHLLACLLRVVEREGPCQGFQRLLPVSLLLFDAGNFVEEAQVFGLNAGRFE